MDHNDNNFLKLLIYHFLPGKKILIVEDEKEIQILMAKYLSKSEIEADKLILASDGCEAIDKMKNENIGLIIVDLVMPNMDGLELINLLKSTAETKQIPLVICSGNVDNEKLKEAIILGVKDILVKPFNYKLFVDKLSRAIALAP